MRVDVTGVQRSAAELGFSAEVIEKVVRLGAYLSEVLRHALLGSVLLLKGGTALNLAQRAPRRLSVDLDFNYVGAEKRQEMIAQRPTVEEAVERIANAQGYFVQKSRDAHAGRKFYLQYDNLAGPRDRIEIDLNFLHRVPLVPPAEVAIWQPQGFPEVRASTVGREELCAGKLCALLDRAVPRDLWDVAQLPSLVGDMLATTRFRGLFIALSGTLDHPLYEYGRDRLERVTDQDVATQLHPVLIAGGRPTATQLCQESWRVIEPLLRLEAGEREFVDRLQAGELVPEILFPEADDLRNRVARHPALLWKARNARGRAASSQEGQ
jgi:predicted nucleotidyltransferase component of viral defense system